MKRMVSLLLSAALLLGLLNGCQPSAAESDPPVSAPVMELSCLDIVMGVWSRLDIGISTESAEYYGFEFDFGRNSDKSPEEMAAYIQGAYGLDEGEWEEACIAREGGMSVVELAVLRFADEEAAKYAHDCLKDYLHGREGDFTGYAPAQAKLAADAALVMEGLYVGLFIVEGSDYAGRVFTEMVKTGEVPEPTPAPEPIDDVDGLLEWLLDFCERRGDDVSDLEKVDGSDPDRLKSIIEEEYGLADYPWKEAAIARGTGSSVFEIAVLQAAEDQDAWKLCDALAKDYLDVKEVRYASFPTQAEMLSEAIVANPKGTNFAILVVRSGAEEAIWNVIDALGVRGYSISQRHFNTTKPSFDTDSNYPDRVKFVQPGKDDMSLYDTTAIRAAWGIGDPSGLSDYDMAVYDAAKAVLDKVLKDGMSDLEKETAIYDWVVNNVDYDWTHQNILTVTPRESFTPYGGLVNRTSVCLGYATTFQLLMDLAGVECITVVGAAFNSEEDHAWNMVRLNGEWYCVDVTWDANFREQGASKGQEGEWNYFNVTSDEMAKAHQWDYANTPEATAENQGRG